jgi:hypothetical protein
VIFTIGYSGSKKPKLPSLKLEELAHIREQLGAVIVDVRARPHSRWRPEMNKPALAERFGGGEYEHQPHLGNQVRALPGKVSYLGIKFLEGWMAANADGNQIVPLLLMCTERAPGDCHRHHAIAMQLPADSVLHLYHDGEEWTAFEAHDLQAAMDEDRDYDCLGLGDPFNADFLRSAGILPWPDSTWGK